jgi:hypothetical protein
VEGILSFVGKADRNPFEEEGPIRRARVGFLFSHPADPLQ